MKKIITYTLRILGGLLVLFILLYIGLSLYVSANKSSLIKKAGTDIGKLIGGTVSISDLSVSVFNNFPYLAIELKKVDVRDSLFTKHGHHFFYAERLFLRLNPLKLIVANVSVNKLEIDSGRFYLFTDSTGYSNGYLLNPKEKPVSSEKNTATKNILNKIEINHTSITLDDRSKGKLFDFFVNKLNVKTDETNTGYQFTIAESIQVRSLAFNLAIGTYLSNILLEGNYTLRYSIAKKELSFDSIPISLSKQPFHFTGIFALGAVQKFDLKAITKNVTVDFAKSLLTQKTAKGIGLVEVKGPLDVTASLNGSLAGGNPLIIARWATEKNTLKTPLLNFDNCSFRGMYTNEVIRDSARDDANSKVEVYGFRGDWQGLTMTSDSLIINNLTTPILSADLRSEFKLTQFNSILQADAMSLTNGTGSLFMRYKGPFDHITPQNASVNGLLHIKDGNIFMHASQSNLSNCNATIHFVNADILIDTLNCNIHNDPIHLSGQARNALALLGDAAGNVSLALNISAPVINIDHISSILYRKLPTKKRSTDARSGNIAKSAQKIDNLLSSGNIAVNLSADKLIFHKFIGRKAIVDISIDNNSWQLKKAALQHGAGSISVTGRVTEQVNNRFGLNAALQMNNVDAQKVWYEFENFGIPALSYKNIKGILSTDAKVFLLLDRSGNFDMNTMSGEADFSIKQGSLINFKPLQDVQTFVFKKRDFTDISFAEIKDKILFNKGVVTINRMEINSSVLSLFVEGIYGVSGNTDISIQLPLSNLKKRDKDYKPENTGAERGGGMSVFLRAKTGDDGLIKIKYDLFKRFRKSAGN
ncbi:MAG: AsmA-like C-terminal region-containing protein [Sediminibacterium sp.]